MVKRMEGIFLQVVIIFELVCLLPVKPGKTRP